MKIWFQAVENGGGSNAKRSKPEEGGEAKTEENRGDDSNKQSNSNQKPPEPPKDYIHVRARRGQATDSHSLAERVRIALQKKNVFFKKMVIKM